MVCRRRPRRRAEGEASATFCTKNIFSINAIQIKSKNLELLEPLELLEIQSYPSTINMASCGSTVTSPCNLPAPCRISTPPSAMPASFGRLNVCATSVSLTNATACLPSIVPSQTCAQCYGYQIRGVASLRRVFAASSSSFRRSGAIVPRLSLVIVTPVMIPDRTEIRASPSE